MKKFYLFFKKVLTNGTSCAIINESSAQGSLRWYSAGVAELADARDLKSRDTRVSYRFETGHRHHTTFHTSRGRAVGPPLSSPVCDGCGECIKACPGHAISEEGLDSWQCSVYYKGAHRSNPFMTEDFLRDDPEREAIINGDKRFDSESARAIYKKMNFLPRIQWGYMPCLCGKKCDVACFKHLKGELI